MDSTRGDRNGGSRRFSHVGWESRNDLYCQFSSSGALRRHCRYGLLPSCLGLERQKDQGQRLRLSEQFGAVNAEVLRIESVLREVSAALGEHADFPTAIVPIVRRNG